MNGDGELSAADLNAIHAAIVLDDNEPKFDINSDGHVSAVDGVTYVEQILSLPVGDSNFDSIFSSADFVTIFQSNKYQKDVDATWSDGDWNFDGRFDTSDLVLAFQRGTYRE
ncbi:MAG: hypothetical protein KDB27_36060 [Planctomycetales bacterium]|nr:hypothetical protein [Planctomycetales bacterium]